MILVYCFVALSSVLSYCRSHTRLFEICDKTGDRIDKLPKRCYMVGYQFKIMCLQFNTSVRQHYIVHVMIYLHVCWNMNKISKSMLKSVYSHFVFVLQEDDKVIELVKKFGPKRWTLISKLLKGRSGKQCRERRVHLIGHRWAIAMAFIAICPFSVCLV